MRAAAEIDHRPEHRVRLLGRGRSRTIGVGFGRHRELHGLLVESLYAVADLADLATRRRGFREAVADLGLAGRVLGGGVGARSGDDVVAASRASGGATGVTVFNDNSAAGLLAAVRAQGLSVPG